MKLTGTNTSVNFYLYYQKSQFVKTSKKNFKIKMSADAKANSRAKIGNIPWQIVKEKFLIFRKNNNLKGMTDKEIHEKFVKISPHVFSLSSYRKLKGMIEQHDKEMSEMECPVCHESHFEIFEDEGVIWTPSCKHPVCGQCLAKTYLKNLAVSFVFFILN